MKDKQKLPNNFEIINSASVLSRFQFITDPILKANVTNAFVYIVFLITTDDVFSLPGSTCHSIFKDIIIQTASIIECLINYKLKLMLAEAKITDKDLTSEDYIYKDIKILYQISPNESVIGGIRKIKQNTIDNETTFVGLNRSALRVGLFDKNLYNHAELIRKARNKIHMSGLDNVDDHYTKNDADEIFSFTNEIIKRIETA